MPSRLLTTARAHLAALSLALFVALFPALLASCAPATEREARQDAGGAPRFVSLNPCLDALLVEIAAPAQVLALSHYSRDAASSSLARGVVERFAATGGTAEEVLALQPDIVLASSFLDPATRAALERAGLRVETFGSPVSIAESLEQVRRIAALAGREAAGEALARRIAGGIAAGPETPGEDIATMLWQPGQIVPGEATLIGELMREAGFASHSAARGLGQADHVALETLLADPPDLLLVAGDSAGQEHPLLARLEDTRVERLPTNLLYCGGPTIPAVRARFAAIRERMEHAAP
ncbi:ABC transporter substrate-binding protein [Erythrobacter sp.]|uniref:ABC transporter substrate-binding protein n=1 Tax=Erythrobacter sp. TaxID=1042 RepID=UPI001425F793|nr:ABC transporter substrate-binding protein [Erythrobacter sp.]QIQ85791.1 MAG: ABC transporter substrate-binding protein [Erythrobacter sp.]